MIEADKTYLGDGAYAQATAHGLVLTTEDGISVTNRIVLEPEVWDSLMRYVEYLKKRAKEENPQITG